MHGAALASKWRFLTQRFLRNGGAGGLEAGGKKRERRNSEEKASEGKEERDHVIAKRRKEEEEEEKDEGEEGQRCQENQTEMARRNAVMMKSAIVPVLEEEEMAFPFLDLMEGSPENRSGRRRTTRC